MPLTESHEFSSATVKDSGHVEVRIDNVIKRGDEIISRVPHRHVLSPGDDLTSEHPKVIAIAEAVWTPEVIAAHEERLAKELAEIEARVAAASASDEEVAIDA